MKKLVILGAGTAGTIMANKLTTALDAKGDRQARLTKNRPANRLFLTKT